MAIQIDLLFISMPSKSIQLQPSKTYHLWWYIVGVLLTPILVGFYILYKKISELSATSYKITDQSITAIHSDYTETVDIANINEVKIHQRWIDKRFGIGSLQLITNTRKVDLIGLKNPENLANMILKAAEVERLRIKEKEKRKREQTEVSAGNLDKLDYLTGLWQQGLITNDEYLQEKKHFEDR